MLTQEIGMNIDQLPAFQKSAYYSGIRSFNTLLCCPRSLTNKKVQIKVTLKRYLNAHSFHSVDEFLMFKNESQFLFS
jgi:hypothetical protein